MDGSEVPKTSEGRRLVVVERRRISIRFEAEAHTVDGQLLDYLKEHRLLNVRDAIIRAAKAYYLPWVYEGDLPPEELRSLAQGAIEELEFRIFQIRKHFLETGQPLPEHRPLTPVDTTPVPPPPPPDPTTPLRSLSLQDVIDHSRVDPSVLDDF
jgi:hypothetical protein